MKDGEIEKVDSSRFETLSYELKGNTLLIYWFMLRNSNPSTSREIQRSVGISSSSLALHHLNKLIELGLVGIDDDGKYTVICKIRPGLLSLFVGSGRFFIPRFVFYSAFTSSLLVSTILLFWPFPDTASVLLLITLLFVNTIFWIESFKLWKIQPV